MMSVLALDLGAYKLHVVYQSQCGVKEGAFKIPELNDPVQEIAIINRTLEKFIGSQQIRVDKLAIASAPVISESGKVKSWPNRAYWNGINFLDYLSVSYQSLSLLEDGQAAALAECSLYGVSDTIVYLGIGTGLAGGITRHQHLIFEHVTEIGHMIVIPGGQLCSCGRRGCLQAYVSSRALIKQCLTKNIIQSGTLNQLRLALDEGCQKAKQVISHAAYLLSQACLSLTEVFQPDRFIIGGGVVYFIPELIALTRSAFTQGIRVSDNSEKTTIEKAYYCQRAPVIGMLKLLSNTD